MRTYTGLFDEMMDPQVVWDSMIDAAEGKLRRPEVQYAIKHFDKTYDIVTRCAKDPNYRPCEDNVHTIIDGANNKPREIEKPKFCPEQILHHMIIHPFKPILLKSLYNEVYGCLPPKVIIGNDGKAKVKKFGPHAAIHRLCKWIQPKPKDKKLKKLYVCEADIHHAYASVKIPVLIQQLKTIIRDPEWIRLVSEFLHYDPEEEEKAYAYIDDETLDTTQLPPGLVLGHYTSPWFFNFYLSMLDHHMTLRKPRKTKRKIAKPIFHYLRYADNIFMISSNKQTLHEALNDMKEYLWKFLGMRLNRSTQVYRFEYPILGVDGKVVKRKNGKDKVKGRAVNALGVVIHYNRVTLRKSSLKRLRKKANKVKQKSKVTWHDGCSICSRMAMIKATDTKTYADKYIKPGLDMHLLKAKIRARTKKMQPTIKERRRMINDGMAESKQLARRSAGGVRYDQQQCGCVPASEH